LVGFGSVGRALARLIAYKWDFIRSRWGVDVRVVGVVDSRGMALKADGSRSRSYLSWLAYRVQVYQALNPTVSITLI
jgi:homoserine dehydrogenase